MKCAKRIFALAFAVVMILSVVSIPASALSTTWVNEFKTFPELHEEEIGFYPGYTKAAQRFLICADEDVWGVRIRGAGGTDGLYGDVTADCVEEYQRRKGISDDRDLGEETWSMIATDLFFAESNTQRYILGVKDKTNNDAVGYVIWVEKIMYPTYTYFYYNGSGQLGDIFHTM